jgi:hypothetical protein
MQIVPKASKPKRAKNTKAKKKAQRRRQKDEVEAKRIGATPERLRQNGGVITDHVPASPKSLATIRRHRAAYECQIDVYLRKGKIDQSEFRAALQFREAWLISAEGIKTTDSSMLERVDGRAPLTVEEKLKNETWARRIVNEAYKELPVGQSLLIVKVCGRDEHVGAEYDVRVLRRGLEKLARLWSFV